MLGNDQYGDCVAVGWANLRRLISAILTPSSVDYPDMGEVEQLYATQNPGFPSTDNGMDMQTMLEYIHTNGGPDGVKPIAFAQVNVKNRAEIQAALAIFGGGLAGINVQNHNMTEFDNGQAWTYDPNDQADGGHCVMTGGYNENR